MVTTCEEVIVQIVLTTRDEHGDKVGEKTSQPIKVFRNAQTRDFWAEVDKAVQAMEKG